MTTPLLVALTTAAAMASPDECNVPASEESELREALNDLKRAKKRKLDVRSSRAVATFAEKIGQIDILANVAGYVHHGTVLDCSEDDWDFSFDLNVKSMHRMISAFLPGMLERARGEGSGGSIINMSSVAGLKGSANLAAYLLNGRPAQLLV